MLQRVLRQQCLVHVTPQQLPLGSLRRKALGVEAHEALDDDAEEDLHDGRRDDAENAREGVEGDTRGVREPEDDRLDGIEAGLEDARGRNHPIDRREPGDVRDELDEADDG